MKRLKLFKKLPVFNLLPVVIISSAAILFAGTNPFPVQKEIKMEKVISKDGTEIAYIKRGSGPPLILVHGTTADHSRWLPIIPYFEQHYTVYAVDRRGRGGSGDSPEYSVMKEAEDIAAVAHSIEEPVSILGHSYGGLVSLEAALLIRNLNKLILYEPPVPTGIAIYPPGTPEKMQKFIDEGKNEDALEVMLKEVVKMPDHEFQKYSMLPAYKRRIEIAPTIPREVIVEINYTFQEEKFKNLEVPTLLLLGGDSPEIFQKATQIVDSVLPNSTVVVMKDQQHVAMDMDPELFVNEVINFLKSKQME